VRLFLKLEAPWAEATPELGEALAFTRSDLPARLHTTALGDRFAPSPGAASDEDHVEVVREMDASSSLGWPVHVVERIVTSTRAAPRRELEVRYAFFEMSGSAVVSGPDDAIARHRDALLVAALSGRPDWSGEVACLADLLVGMM
jgi:hypothetical protein